MIKNRVFTHALIALALSSFAMSVPMTANAMQSPHKASNGNPISPVAAIAHLLGLGINTPPELVWALFYERNPELAVPNPAPLPVRDDQQEIGEQDENEDEENLLLTDENQPDEVRTPQNKKKRGRTEHTPNGGANFIAIHDGRVATIHQTPGTAAMTGPAIYRIGEGAIQIPAELQLPIDRILTHDELVDRVMAIIRCLLEQSNGRSNFYFGKALVLSERVRGHLHDVLHNDGMCKAENVRELLAQGKIPQMQGFAAHEEQRALAEGLVILGTRVTVEGWNGDRPSKKIRDFYKLYLKKRVKLLREELGLKRVCKVPKLDLEPDDKDDENHRDGSDSASTDSQSTPASTSVC